MDKNELLKNLFRIELYCREHELNDIENEFYGNKLKFLRSELEKLGVNEFDYNPYDFI